MTDNLNEFENVPSDFWSWSNKELHIYILGILIGLANGVLWTLLILKLI